MLLDKIAEFLSKETASINGDIILLDIRLKDLQSKASSLKDLINAQSEKEKLQEKYSFVLGQLDILEKLSKIAKDEIK